MAVAGAILVVHLTHAKEIDASIGRMSLDAVVHLDSPKDDEAIADLGARAGGKAEAIITRLALMQTSNGTSFHRAIGAAEGRWLSTVRLGEGRLPGAPDAAEVVIDYGIAHEHGLGLGDDVQLYPGPQAPEGVWVTVVGITDGLSTGALLLPLETARTLFGLPGLATGAQISSPQAPADLQAALRSAPDLQDVHVRAFATQELRANFKGMTAVIFIAMFLAAAVAVVYIAVLSGLDAQERAPELATLEAIGWPASALLLTSVTEVYIRGILALAIALLTTPLLSSWLLGNIADVSQVHLRAVSHWTPCLVSAGLLLLLLPLSCWPSWRAFRRTPPAVSLRRLG
jgi:ABC-type lipoprotein release transport system permease subunit